MINHFTQKFEHIKSILTESSFRLSYCSEEFRDDSGSIISHAAHPMVCFSEYSKSELSDKKITYGSYCISMKKEWAIKNKLNPVLYIDKNSHVARGLKKLLLERKKEKFQSNLKMPVMQIKCFTKHVTGYNSYLKKDNFNFKDENEWRFVPQKSDINNGYISLNYSTYSKNKSKYNKRLKAFPLYFKENDIEAIFVMNEIEINSIKKEFPCLEKKIHLKCWTNL